MASCHTGAYYIQRRFYSGYFRGHEIKHQNLLLTNGLYISVWDASHQHNGINIYNISGLEDYFLAILEPDENVNLPCALADRILNDSVVMMTTKV